MANDIKDSIEERLATLEQLVSTLCETNTIDLANEQTDDARLMALYSIVLELAERAGVSESEFQQHFETRFRWWHDYYLRKAEDVSPSRAAEIDTRAISDCEVSAEYPPLFGPPPPSQT